MSLDVVDDLEGAEDLLGELTEALRLILTGGPFVAVNDALRTLNNADMYCRATCQTYWPVPSRDVEPGFCYDGTPSEDCGCPCHGREQQ